MVQYCCVPHCTKPGYRIEGNQRVTFHGFPSDSKLLKVWCQAIKREPGKNFNLQKHTKVCSLHFKPSDFESDVFRTNRRLKTGAVPSIFAWTQQQPPNAKKRAQSRKRQKDTIEQAWVVGAQTQATLPPQKKYRQCSEEETPEMSKRRAAKAARQNIKKQLKDGPHVIEYSEGKNFDPLKIRIKREPVDEEDEQTTYTWQHSPIAKEEEEEKVEKDNGTKATGDVHDDEEEEEVAETRDTDQTAGSSGINKSGTPITPIEAGTITTPQVHLPKAGNMQVKVIRACPKCTPVVMELAAQANKASKTNQELKDSLAENNMKCESVTRLKKVLNEAIDRNKTLERSLSTLREMNIAFPVKVMHSDLIMQIFCGMRTCNQFKWLYEKIQSRVSVADKNKLKSVRLDGQEQLLVILMYLRCNPSLDELEYWFEFRLTPEDLTKLMTVWLPLLAEDLKPRLVEGPTCVLKSNFPPCFESVGRNLQGIIHRFEITREKPSIWDVGQTSRFLKCIVALSPKGIVIGVSQVVDQTVVDTDLFDKSSISKLFVPTNIIVDTQALGLEDHVQFGVKVLRPPFGKEMGEDAQQHIEAIIDRLMQFRILQGPVMRKITKAMMDDIVVICGALVNLHVDSL